MRFADIPVEEMIKLAKNVVNLLEGPELSAINPQTRAEILAEIGDNPKEAAAYHAEANNYLALAYSMFELRDKRLSPVRKGLQRTNLVLKSANAPDEQFLLAGFNAPRRARRTYVAQKPEGLSVLGYSNVGNRGTFEENNRSGAVFYQIWRREGKDGKWELRETVWTGKFTDSQVTFGVRYEYKVRAVAAKNTSEFSNTVSVNGG